MNPLTAVEFVTTLAGAEITLVPEPPRELIPEGAIVVWPSCTADYEDPPGRHIEALVFSGTHGGYVMIMVSKRVYAALGGT